MKLEPLNFGLALGLATAIAWILCSLLVAVLPDATLSISGHMLHTDISQMGWHLTWGGFVLGLVVWSLSAGIFGWLLALIYNRFAG